MEFKVVESIIPPNEAERMAAVRRYDILDTPPDGAFDRVTAIAARRFNVPIAIISIVDHDRIWFKSHYGLDAKQIDREPGLCASAILQATPYVVEDAKRDVRTLANPLVAGAFGLQFYAGAPLTTSEGFNLGTLCVIDKSARTVGAEEIDDLRDLASLVVDQLELRLSARRELTRANHLTDQAVLMSREIEHRVANSLQFVSSVLRLQGKRVPPDLASQFDVAANRVNAVARIHRHLLEGNNVAHIPAFAYLQRLCEDLSEILNAKIAVTGKDALLNTKAMQSVGLLVNEMVTNAAKHGSGKITVDFDPSPSECSLTVCDEGRGLPADFDFKAQKGLGMKIIDVLAQQLGGKVSVAPSRCLVATFPRRGELSPV